MSNEVKTTKDILATLPIKLEEALRTEAKRKHRSRNAQLVAILEERYTVPSEQQPNTPVQAWQSFN